MLFFLMLQLNKILFIPCRSTNQSDTFNYLLNNFNRHYTSTKAPFGIYLNANAWFNQEETAYRLTGYTQFLDYLNRYDDVYVVSIAKVKIKNLDQNFGK